MRKASLRTGVLTAAIALTVAMAARPAFAVKEVDIGVTSASIITAKGFPPVSPEHLLEIGVRIVGDERVITNENGRVQLLFLDHSALTIGPNSEVVLDKFVYDPDAGVGELAFSAVQGIFRLVGGKISKKTAVTITTPTATFGIRGGIAIVSIRSPAEGILLFGKMTVCPTVITGADECVTATRPGSLVTVPSLGNISPPVLLSADQISGKVGQLESPPGQNGGTAVLVFKQDVKQAVLGALTEPAAGPSDAPPSPTPPPTDPPINTADIISDATEESISEEIAAGTPPTAIDLDDNTAPEDLITPNGVVGTLSATEADGDPVTFSITGDPDGKFQIVGDELQLKAALDFEAMMSHDVTVQATDKDGSFDMPFTITVTNVNEPPTSESLTNDTVPENLLAPNGVIGMLSAVDPDAGDTATFAIVNDPDGKFKIGGAAGDELQLAAPLDFEAMMSHGVTVRATDNDGLTFDMPFTITVTNVPEPPAVMNLSGGYASEPHVINITSPVFDGIENPARNFDFDDGEIANGRFTATLFDGFDVPFPVDLPVNEFNAPFDLGSAGTVTPFGPVTGSGFVTGDLDFLVYLLQETDNNLAGLAGGTPLSGPFPTTGFAAHDIVLNGFAYQPTAALGGTDLVGAGLTEIPFLTPAVGGDIPNASVSPILSAFHPNLFSFPNAGRSVALQASLAIDGQGAAQRSALSISTFAYFAEADFNGLVINGGTVGTGRTTGNARIRRIGSALSSPQDALTNAFFGEVTTMGFALDSDRFRNLTHQASLGAESGHSFSAQGDFTAVDFLAGAVRTAAPADLGSMRSSQTLNGYAAGIMESRSAADLQFTDFAFGNVDNDPTDVTITTNATTNRLAATFNVRDVASSAALDKYVISFASLTGPNRARNAFIDDSRFAARETRGRPGPLGEVDGLGTLGGVAGTFTRAGMVTQQVVPVDGAMADNFLPDGVSFCQCDFLRWGYWNLDLVVDPGTGTGRQRDRAHIATWVAGGNMPSSTDFMDLAIAKAEAVYNGHLIGNVKNNGNFYVAAGDFGMTFKFADPTASTINVNSFDGVGYDANVGSLTNGVYQATGADTSALVDRTINFTGSFFSGGGDPVAETGGQFNVDGGPNYIASGTFAGAK